MNFVDLLAKAKVASDEKMILIEMYKPLLVKESVVNGIFDEDLYAELILTLLNCIQAFRI
jgi:hypothetical protein